MVLIAFHSKSLAASSLTVNKNCGVKPEHDLADKIIDPGPFVNSCLIAAAVEDLVKAKLLCLGALLDLFVCRDADCFLV